MKFSLKQCIDHVNNSSQVFRIGALLCLLALAACTTTSEPKGADHVFINAKVFTADRSNPSAQAVAVHGNEIVYVGSNEGVAAYSAANTAVHDLAGQMLLPGFIDSHMHPVAGGAYAQALSLDTFGTVDDWVAAIKEYAANDTSSEVLFGYGFLASTFGPVGPTRQLIDAIVPDRPVILMDEGFHAAWVNTKALEQLGIDENTPDPIPDFSYYKREGNGYPTGYLLEGTASMAMDGLDAITEQVVRDGTALVVNAMNSYGVTAAFDAGAIGYGDMVKQVWDGLAQQGGMNIRVVGSYRPEDASQAATAVDNAKQWRDSVKGENYHYRVLKIMQDGTIEGRTAAMFEDYQGEPGNNGATVFSQQQMNDMVSGAAAENIDVHIHALGERAIFEALNAIEVARQNNSDSLTRYAICHIQVITDADLKRFADLGVVAQSTPLWAAYDTYGKQFVSEDQFNRYWRFKSLSSLGVKLSFGSDFPASGAGMLGMSPIFNIEIGHTRQDPGDPNAPVQPRVTESLDVDELLHGYTIDAAYQMHMDDKIGSIEVGKLADLVQLDRDIFAADPHDIHTIEVVMTMMDGKVVYKREQ
ncbi:MAG: amidohydrolase [Pseudomonadales bacterium]